MKGIGDIMSNKKNMIPFHIIWITIWCGLSGIVSVHAQQKNVNVVQEAPQQGISRDQLKSMGIDPDNPTQAAERARQLGVPDADIQKAIRMAPGADTTAMSIGDKTVSSKTDVDSTAAIVDRKEPV